jgi:ribosomal protein S18 acetylase RimI-like enzyme
MLPRASLDRLRGAARPLLDERSPADALAVYYALYHPADRTELFVYPNPANDGPPRAEGFLVRARTGMDLFRPLVTLRAEREPAAQALLEQGLLLGRPVYLTIPESHAPWVNKYLSVSEAELHRIYRYDAERYEPEINVLVVTSQAPDGLPRCEIRASDRAGAVAGVNWQSPRFAEVYVYTEPAARGRGWGKSVVRALVGLLLKAGRTPLYVVAENNEYSIRLAETVGFVDTGRREYVGQGLRAAPA